MLKNSSAVWISNRKALSFDILHIYVFVGFKHEFGVCHFNVFFRSMLCLIYKKKKDWKTLVLFLYVVILMMYTVFYLRNILFVTKLYYFYFYTSPSKIIIEHFKAWGNFTFWLFLRILDMNLGNAIIIVSHRCLILNLSCFKKKVVCIISHIFKNINDIFSFTCA